MWLQETRRAYRELFYTAPIGEAISGAIMFKETLHQAASDGTPFTECLTRQGVLPGIKVDEGLVPLEGCPGETSTRGLDSLAASCQEYVRAGARFAKWRAALKLGEGCPSDKCIETNARQLAEYARICQVGASWLDVPGPAGGRKPLCAAGIVSAVGVVAGSCDRVSTLPATATSGGVSDFVDRAGRWGFGACCCHGGGGCCIKPNGSLPTHPSAVHAFTLTLPSGQRHGAHRGAGNLDRWRPRCRAVCRCQHPRDLPLHSTPVAAGGALCAAVK